MSHVSGAATVRIAMPSNMQESLIFHYNLKFYDSEGDSFEGVSLKRFVMQVSVFFKYSLLKFQDAKNVGIHFLCLDLCPKSKSNEISSESLNYFWFLI